MIHIWAVSTGSFINQQRKRRLSAQSPQHSNACSKLLAVFSPRPNACSTRCSPCVVLQSRPPTNSFLQTKHRAGLGATADAPFIQGTTQLFGTGLGAPRPPTGSTELVLLIKPKPPSLPHHKTLPWLPAPSRGVKAKVELPSSGLRQKSNLCSRN